MTIYHYATVDLETFLAANQVVRHKDSYMAHDERLETIRELLKNGYRVHTIMPESRTVIMERASEEIPGKVRAMLDIGK